jgi:hypothetical protein
MDCGEFNEVVIVVRDSGGGFDPGTRGAHAEAKGTEALGSALFTGKYPGRSVPGESADPEDGPCPKDCGTSDAAMKGRLIVLTKEK